MLFVELSLIISMFFTGNQILGLITIIFGVLSFICAMFGLTGKGSSNKIDLLINIPTMFCYCYYIYILTVLV